MVNDSRSILPTVVYIFNQGGSEATRLIPPRPPQPPLIPWDIDIAIAPSPTPSIIVVAVPWLVVPTRAVNHSAIVFISALIAWCVAHFHLIIAGIIYTRKS